MLVEFCQTHFLESAISNDRQFQIFALEDLVPVVYSLSYLERCEILSHITIFIMETSSCTRLDPNPTPFRCAFGADGRNNTLYTRFIPKIIDYGRSYFDAKNYHLT
jgi:hypothetical protein